MYSKIHDTIWQTLKRKGVSAAGKELFVYLITCPHRSVVGLYYLPFQYIAADLERGIETVDRTVSELFQKGLIEYDKDLEMVLVKNFLEYNPLPNGNVEKSAVKFVSEMPKTALLRSLETVLKPFAEQYRNLFQTVCQTVSNTKAITEAKTEAITEAEVYCAERSSDDDASTPAPVITLTLNDKTEYPILEEQVQEWVALYPAVDVIQQLRAMKGWLRSNPSKRKTKGGILRFCNAWLAKEQNRGSGLGQRRESGNQFLEMLREEEARNGQG